MTVELNSPLDMHLHLRDKEMLKIVAPLTSHSFAGALVMPNLVPPIDTKEALLAYKEKIISATKDDIFKPYMTLFFRDSYDYDFLKSFGDELTAIKLYPAGITTNSKEGVSGFDIKKLSPTLEAMSELGLPLCIHGETNGFVMDREAEFVAIYEKLSTTFPNLKIIMEHITTKESVAALEKHENLYATITLHHLLITLDDVAGGLLKPHLFCKPIAKRPHDRDALLDVALNGHNKVMFGSDSAPHPKSVKESCGCAAGVFTAPLALAKLTEIFVEKSNIQNLQKFVSDNAKEIYGITPPAKKIILEDTPMKIPHIYGEVVPMYAGENIFWSIKEVRNMQSNTRNDNQQ